MSLWNKTGVIFWLIYRRMMYSGLVNNAKYSESQSDTCMREHHWAIEWQDEYSLLTLITSMRLIRPVVDSVVGNGSAKVFWGVEHSSNAYGPVHGNGPMLQSLASVLEAQEHITTSHLLRPFVHVIIIYLHPFFLLPLITTRLQIGPTCAFCAPWFQNDTNYYGNIRPNKVTVISRECAR